MKTTAKQIDAIFRHPMMIEETALQVMMAALNAAAALPSPQALFGRGRSGSVVTIKSEIAVIPVYNILSYRPDFWSYFFEETSYQDIRANFRQALGDSTVSAIVFDIASPGGTVEGCFDLVDEIYQARGTKPIYAMVNENAYSAAYLIASAADKVYLPRTGGGGSIGVRAIHLDQSGWEEQAGIKYTEVYAGARKIDGTEHAPLSDEARAIMQKRTDQIYDLFCDTVARNRGIKTADVRAQQAEIYYGKDAVASGLADAVLSWDAAWKKIIGAKSNTGGAMKTKLEALFAGQPQEAVAAALAEMGYAPKLEGAIVVPAMHVQPLAAALGITAEQLTGDLTKIEFAKLGPAATAAAVSAAEAKVKADTLAVLDLCGLAGKPEMAADLIRKGASLETARTEVMAAKAGESDGSRVKSTVSALGTGEVNPLLADAKKRAEASAKK